MPNDNFDESHSDRLARKGRQSPMMLVGIAGLLVVCGVGAIKFKNRGTMPVSQFLMQLRVAAQGTVVAALTLGAVASMMGSRNKPTDDDGNLADTASKRKQ